MSGFQIVSSFEPRGDQPEAIEKLVSGFQKGAKLQTLMGVTGSGKTFTMAHVIARLGTPVLVLSHNKTLAAQLFEEFRDLLPNNEVIVFRGQPLRPPPDVVVPVRLPRPTPPSGWMIAAATKLQKPPTRRGLGLLATGALVAAMFLFAPPETYTRRRSSTHAR